ncbi:hypothetical protein GQ43DRAFT_464572 [Delitschia confertaspora ATCC 74209]|uniref:Enhancer of mRNA-decapping protein 3 n=1 Tax=Delitschia confertaspora ATCC 74209 TaxID=1513339 RepID=A0A9P4JNK5_9PLEO|nr:hypothetical protein GQ43DRAFT_464572 [Delitschia confertaspora ATCC 74209]
MADSVSSVKSRIAALNLEQVHAPTPGVKPAYSYEPAVASRKARPPPPPPPSQRASTEQYKQSTNNPPLPVKRVPTQSIVPKTNAAQQLPALPPRPPPRNNTQPPSLPPRKASQHSLTRKASVESVSTIASGYSTFSVNSTKTNASSPANLGGGQLYHIRAPAYDPSKLPPLPPKRTQIEEPNKARVPLKPTKSTPSVIARPPTLPSRPPLPTRPNSTTPDIGALEKPRSLPPRKSALSFGLNKSTETPPPLPANRPSFGLNTSNEALPPLPTNRPNLGPKGGAIDLTSASYDSVVLRSGTPALVEYYTPWCKYCKELAPVYDELATNFQNTAVTVAKIDVDKYKDIGRRYNIQEWPTLFWFDGKSDTPEKFPWGRDLESFSEWITDKTGIKPNQHTYGVPPPIPLASRPNLAAIQASKPKTSALTVCLKCRDFSGPDGHAARFPREAIPSCDIRWLAVQLTSPFPSLTDKARALFTWLHHNIDYNVKDFFSGNLKHSTPESTIQTGLAVCQGYAELFRELGIAAGLEAIMVTGNGKGYSHSALKPGDPVPPFDGNHAWNAVRIDDGEWKLIDCCWGAGHIQGPGQPYVREFHPERFTQDNNEFGLDHFPEDPAHFFRTDGRSSISWEEYMLSDAQGCITTYSPCEPEYGIGKRTFQPALKHIKVDDPQNGPVMRFSFATICSHWDNEKRGKGKPYLLVLKIGGRDGRAEDYLPFQSDGRVWWLDVARVELGCPGKKLSVYAVKTFDKKDARGLSIEEYLRKKKRVAYSFEGIAAWELVELGIANGLAIQFSFTMASGLIGISILVTLRHPPGIVIQGTVGTVNEQTSQLTLHNVFFPASGHHLEAYVVEGPMIADIKVNSPPVPPPQAHHPPPRPTQPPPPVQPRYNQYLPSHGQTPSSSVNQTQQSLPFLDPAIVSMGKKPVAPAAPAPSVSAIPQEAPATPIKSLTAALPTNTSPFVGVAKERSSRKPSAATLAAPFSSLNIADAAEPETDDAATHPKLVRRSSISKTRTGKPMEEEEHQQPTKQEETWKRTRRGGKSRRKEVVAHKRRNGVELASSPEALRKGTGNGWRQTPLLQDPERVTGRGQPRTPGVIGGTVGIEAVNSSNRKTKRQRALEAEAQNGWATEDATDIQELPEFDFAGNLSKFDKRSVFDQIRNEDTTADEDRLVHFNRISKPGTFGGKNLHPTEHVLEGRRMRSVSNSSSDDDLSDFGSGHNSRRALSRASAIRAPTRQGSGIQGDNDALSHSVGPASAIPRASRSLISRPYASSHTTTVGSPNPGRAVTPTDSAALESTTSRPCLKIVSNNRRCPTITPGGMLAVEEIAEVDFGLSEDLIAENAGRGIAEVVLSTINPGGRRLARENHNSKPVIVVLAGNHRGGARAIAAARQLDARGPRVMVALLGFERPEDWDKDVRRQVELFRKFGGRVRAWDEVEGALKRQHAPPELIIDALLGRHKEFDALGDEDRRNVLAIVGWANKSRAAVLAVETPSGVGGSTGEVAILEGEPLEVRAKYIVCLGAPRSGLLKALQNGAGKDPAWLIWVVDIGVNRPWKDAGIGGGKGVRFGESWVVQLKYSQGDEEDGG